MEMQTHLKQLAEELDGELYFDSLMKTLYATDASVYKEFPLAVALPKHTADIKRLIAFANQYQTSLIPRAAGTSLAGQCVGSGIVVDISKYMTNILEFNQEERWIRVQPGIIRDELNTFLRPYGLFFSPNTSTANRCMIGGMVGNNSCGTTSIVYGATRDHILELEVLLSDGSAITFNALDRARFEEKKQQDDLEGQLYRYTDAILKNPDHQKNIRAEFPKPSIHRRNTGYAIDVLLESERYTEGGEAFNFCKLLCGSEGTLAFTTAIKLDLDVLPPPVDVVACVHFASMREAMRAVLVAMQHQPSLCELMDKIILDCVKDNIEQQQNRFFVEGDPAAILMVEFRGETKEEAEQKAEQMIADMQAQKMGYSYPIVHAPKTKRIWALRKASLGLLANIPGDEKAVACIEDTAVDIQDLPDYIDEFTEIMEGFGQRSVYYAHAGAGEIHLRPILDLKKAKDQQLFYEISKASAELVKKYDGSLSGEHGDGRVRAAFIPIMIGEANYELIKEVKKQWDPNGIFNPGKIVDAAPMNASLRYEADQETPEFDTVFDFSATEGILRAAEKCNGSGDCRKLSFAGGTMCPSYMATRNEKDTTRGRANVLRTFLTMNTKENPFNHPEIKEALDLCLSCKGCTAECPSNVDMSTLKAEFLHQYYKSNGTPLRSRAIANIGKLNGLGAIFPGLTNFMLSNSLTSSVLKKTLGVASKRSLPLLHRQSLRTWFKKKGQQLKVKGDVKGKIYFFCDEFTNFNDTDIGIKAIQLLIGLGYGVELLSHAESGRAHLSKGLLMDAQKMAKQNVASFRNLVSADHPLIGVEPSAILSFRDEYPKLVDEADRTAAIELGKHALLLEEFLFQEIEKGNITAAQFHNKPKKILLHGHCHQKALSRLEQAAWVLGLPSGYQVEIIPSGCCGMAGSFGYEAEHYDLSMQIGEIVLFPTVREAKEETIIAAAGTSCRHQIKDGTGRLALHPIEILYDAFIR